MQEHSFQLSSALAKITPTVKVVYGGSQKWLFIVYPYLLVAGLIKAITFKPDLILLGDGVMAPLGWVLKVLTGKKVVCVVMGLDVTYNSVLFQKTIPFFLRKMDRVIAISNYTKNECLHRGVKTELLDVIPCGVDLEKYQTSKPKKEICQIVEQKFGLQLHNKKILLTVGRLVKRKGHAWFIEQVMSNLPAEYIYLVAGDGPEQVAIEMAIKKHQLEEKVYLFGKVSEEDKKYLLNIADVFVMPNIKIEGNPEGFGIVALEAASVGLPVVASKIEGINDAVISGKTGYLVSSLDSVQFLKKIYDCDKIRPTKMNKEIDWTNLTNKHLEVFAKLQ